MLLQAGGLTPDIKYCKDCTSEVQLALTGKSPGEGSPVLTLLNHSFLPTGIFHLRYEWEFSYSRQSFGYCNYFLLTGLLATYYDIKKIFIY